MKLEPEILKLGSVTLTINGEARAVPDGLTLSALVAHLGMKGDRVAIERNREIVSREQWAEVVLREGDRLEIVHFVGGGCCDSRSRLTTND